MIPRRNSDNQIEWFEHPNPVKPERTLVQVIVMNAGLGNQLMEIAAGYGIAQRLGLHFRWSWAPSKLRKFGLTHWGFAETFHEKVPVVASKLGQGNLKLVRICEEAIQKSEHPVVGIACPFQAEECFSDHADEIREIYKLEPFPLKVPEGRTPVAVQVRRTDYALHPRLNVTTPGYFLNGIEFIRQRIQFPHFFVVSDDPQWCRQQFGHVPDVTVMPPQSAIDGLRTMVACKAAVISNSTFGWWGAWLSGSDLVVVPEIWAHNMRFYGDWKPAPDRWHRVSLNRKVETPIAVSPPPPMAGFQEFPKKYPRAIVIPWHAKADRWHSLRYCLRSIHQNFTDKTCPIIILGTSRPPWLTFQRHRVIYEETWLYSDALVKGVQIADEVCWVNDDQAFLLPTGWDDLRRPWHYGSFSEELLADFHARPNPWRQEVLKAIEKIGPEALNYSCHVPYLFEREKARVILEEVDLQHKVPFELYYLNRYAVAPRQMNGERTMLPEFNGARFLNWTDNRLTPELKAAIAKTFPDYTPWEVRIPFTI